MSRADTQIQHRSPTAARLLAIRPGEEMVYYRGNLPADLERAKGYYREILEEIRSTAEFLDQQGIAQIKRKQVDKSKTMDARSSKPIIKWRETVYTAIGLDRKSVSAEEPMTREAAA